MINSFESMMPAEHFFIYFMFAISMTIIMRFIFKKHSFYYVLFLCTVLIFSCFTKELFSTLPYDVLEVPRIVAKMTGIVFGYFSLWIWEKQRKRNRRLS